MAYRDHMGASLIDASRNLEPVRNNNFEVYIPGLDDEANFRLSVASYSAPQINMSTIQTSYGNDKVKFAGLPEFPDSTIVLNDYITMDTLTALQNWSKQVYDPKTAKIGYAFEYKRYGYLMEYTAQGEFLRQWILQGIWPSSLNLGDYNQEGGQIRQITVTMVYDKIYLDEDTTAGRTLISNLRSRSTSGQSNMKKYTVTPENI